jgi:hypothetical protein
VTFSEYKPQLLITLTPKVVQAWVLRSILAEYFEVIGIILSASEALALRLAD